MTIDRARALAASPEMPMEMEAAVKHAIVRLSPFSELPGPSRDAILALAKLERLPRRHRLTEQGEPTRGLVLLGSGRVKLERLTGRTTLALGHRGPGQLVGQDVVTGAGVAMENASVVDDVEAVTLPLAGLRGLLSTDAFVRAAMAAALVDQHRATQDRLAALLLYGVEARLIGLLTDAARRWGTPCETGQRIAAPFTHMEIAQLVGSTRETVTVMLGRLKRAGFIAFDQRRIIIRDHAGLARHAAAL